MWIHFYPPHTVDVRGKKTVRCALKFLGKKFFIILRFDIILDENLKPWLLEVNHTPSFHTDSPLDEQVKRNLILDTLLIENISNKAKKL